MAISRTCVTGEPPHLHSLRDQDECFMGGKIKEYLGSFGLPQQATAVGKKFQQRSRKRTGGRFPGGNHLPIAPLSSRVALIVRRSIHTAEKTFCREVWCAACYGG
jgi:hypothetical protein